MRSTALKFASLNRRTIARITVLVCFGGLAFGSVLSRGSGTALVAEGPLEAQATPRRTPRRTPTPRKYSEFPHNVEAHRVECSSCHKFPSENWNKVRTGDDAFPDITDYPKHESCVGCHKQQFFKGNPPTVCSICHTKPGPRGSARHPFPNPREIFDLSPKGKTAVSDFAVEFPHDKHIDVVSQVGSGAGRFINAAFERRSSLAEESCAVCHKTLMPQGESDVEYVTKPPATLGEGYWLKKGTFKTSPIGHTTCFTCHNADSGLPPSPETCSACHKLKQPDPATDFDPKLAASMGITDKVMLLSWRRRDSSATFRHDFMTHAELECATCHNVTAIKTSDHATKKVAIASCTMCHATASTADGGALNFEMEKRAADVKFRCTKCHVVFGSLPVPKSHIDALAAAKGE